MFASLFPGPALALLGALISSAWAQDPAPEPVQDPAPVEAGSAAPAPSSEWLELLERDRRTSFNSHSAELALAALAGGLDGSQRPVALFTLGASGERAMGPRLESWAIEGTPADRRAAILGLCESGFASLELLMRLGRSSVLEVRESALLALARAPGERARALFQKLCEADGPGVEACARARAFASDPTTVQEFPTGRAWLELRWDAARRYGLVDGQPWRAHLLSELEQDPEYLDAVVYGAASDLHRLGTADHFLEVALGAGLPSRLRPVVNAIPSELDRMVHAGVWFPATQEEWAQILHEIDERRLESLTLEILRAARAFPDLSAHASVLLVRAGSFEGLSMLELDIASPDPLKRQRIAETLGGTHEIRYVDLLETLRSDDSLGVRAASVIAQMRLGHTLAAESVRNTLQSEPGPERTALVEGLARLAYLPEISNLLEEHVAGFTPDERLTAAIELCREGDVAEIPTLQAALSEELLRGPRGDHFVQALVRSGSNAQLGYLFALFPLEDARDVNVRIALAMCERREPAVLGILRTALWQAPFERSLLAGALMAHVSGIDSIRIELERPPRGARAPDIRRVGYALGEWGGIPEVERLGRRRTAADPALQGALLGALGARTH